MRQIPRLPPTPGPFEYTSEMVLQSLARKLGPGCCVLPLLLCWACVSEDAAPPLPEPPSAIPAAPPPPSAARPPRATAQLVIRQAKEFLQDGGKEATCGPYRLWTDVTDARFLELCQRLAAPLDITYQQRYGLKPQGEPEEGIFLFEEIGDFQAFALKRSRLRVGYSGFSDSSKGFVALYRGEVEVERWAQTLAHELTHLVNRRALGPGLPPWLSEGLADGMGDPAGPEGLGSLKGLRGIEGPAKRLRMAYSAGRVPSLERLVSLRRDQFDGGIVSYDYEMSALFLRYLLQSPELTPRFRELLESLARAERYSPELVRAKLGRSWAELDQGLKSWLSGL